MTVTAPRWRSRFRSLCPATSCRVPLAVLPQPDAGGADRHGVESVIGFLVPGTKLAASFIFATEDGTISAWTGGLTPPNNAVIAVDNSQSPNPVDGAVYKGLVFGVNVKGVFLFATNFRAGTIDVFGPNQRLLAGAFPARDDGREISRIRRSRRASRRSASRTSMATSS